MKGFALAAVLSSVRHALAILVALVAIAGAAYLGTHRLSNPDHYAYGVCPWYGSVSHGFPRVCRPPARADWQIPLAILTAIGGLGAAAAVGGSTERRALRV